MQLLWLVPYGLIFIAVQRLGLSHDRACILTVALLTVYWTALIVHIKRNDTARLYGVCALSAQDKRNYLLLLPLLLMPAVNAALGTFQITVLTTVYIAYIAFGEEFFFRGFLLGVLRQRCGVWLGSIISAVLFALMHCFNGVSAVQLLCAAGVGFALSASRFLTGSLVVPVVIHFCINVTGWQTAAPEHAPVYIALAAAYTACGVVMLRKSK